MVSSAQEEVVVCTYSGRIIGLTREPLVDQAISQEVTVTVMHTAVSLEKVLCLHLPVSPPPSPPVSILSSLPFLPPSQVQAKLEALRQEVEGLEAQVDVAKEQYQQTASSAKEKMEVLSALPQFPINDKFVLNQDEAWYTLSIELQSSIDTVVLQVRFARGSRAHCRLPLPPPSQSNVPVDLQEVDKSSAVVSYSPPDPEVRAWQSPKPPLLFPST